MEEFKHVTPEYMASSKLADRIIGWMAFVGLIVLLGTDIIEKITG